MIERQSMATKFRIDNEKQTIKLNLAYWLQRQKPKHSPMKYHPHGRLKWEKQRMPREKKNASSNHWIRQTIKVLSAIGLLCCFSVSLLCADSHAQFATFDAKSIAFFIDKSNIISKCLHFSHNFTRKIRLFFWLCVT